MDEMEVDKMELDGSDIGDNQIRLERAVKKLQKRFGPPEHEAIGMTMERARDVLREITELSSGNKINVTNAFDLMGIDALKKLVFSERARDSALQSEGHFQYAGIGLEASTKIYCKRVDAVYNLANSMGATTQVTCPGDEEDADGQDGTTTTSNDEAKHGAKTKKRRGTSNAEATIVEDSALRQRVKEPTFGMDPGFVRTSRLIDENSPQGLLLHNLQVLKGSQIVLDYSIRTDMHLPHVHNKDAETVEPIDAEVMIDVTRLPGMRECLTVIAVSDSASISPGIEQLHELLQPQPELAGLKIASQVCPIKLLRDALAANESARAAVIERAFERQTLQQVEDAMDVDIDDGGMDDDDNHYNAVGQEGCDTGPGGSGDHGDESLSNADRSKTNGGVDDGVDDDTTLDMGGNDSFGCGSEDVRDDDVDIAMHFPEGNHCESGLRGDVNLQIDDETEDREDRVDQDNPDDELALLSILCGATTSKATSSMSTVQRTWWKSRARKAPAARTSKPRVRKITPEYESLDWHSSPVPLLEAVQLHTYRTARRDASAKLCMPLEEPPRLEALRSYFSAIPAAAYLRLPVSGSGPLAAAYGLSKSVQETWRALLLADCQRDRLLRRGLQTAATRKSLGNNVAEPTVTVAGVPEATDASAEGMDGPFESANGGDPDGCGEDGGDAGGGFAEDDNGADDGGYDGYDSEDDGGDIGGSGPSIPFSAQDGRGPSLEELLQPPRRVRQFTVKYDKTAGVADVASLKASIEVSLKHLAATTALQRRKSVPLAPQSLSFQNVLDHVSAQDVIQSRAGFSPGRRTSNAGGGGRGGNSFLTGVSTHLAFICLLHLANERGLALGSSGQFDTLMITGLGDLVAQ